MFQITENEIVQILILWWKFTLNYWWRNNKFKVRVHDHITRSRFFEKEFEFIVQLLVNYNSYLCKGQIRNIPVSHRSGDIVGHPIGTKLIPL